MLSISKRLCSGKFARAFPSSDIVFVAAKRTPFGKFGGTLKDLTATDLGVIASQAALAQCKIDPSAIDHVIYGNVIPSSADAIYLARHVGLRSGLPQSTPAVTINRLCGSSFQTVVDGAFHLALGEARAVLVGGSENMSQSPHVIRGARWGIPLAQSQLEDSLWTGLEDSYAKSPMGLTAENLAEKYGITQAEIDEYSVSSQQRYTKASEAGLYSDELTPVSIKSGKTTKVLSADEHPRADTTIESFAKLPKVFKKNGVVHAGAASGICDGAVSLVMTTMAFAEKNGLKPLGRFVSYGVSGCDPAIMGIGPVPAISMMMKRSNFTWNDVDLIEINEAFAPQVLSCAKALDLPKEKLNLDGGAIAVGHPLAASGGRITAHLLYALKKKGKRYGVGAACIGGGQGIAVLVEAL